MFDRGICMINKEKLIGILLIIAIIVFSGVIWWNVPTFIINISPSKVSEIKIFDGNTGKAIIITDTTDIEHIINNLNEISVKKERISFGVMGYSFRTTIYKTNGSVYKEFIINSSNTIRKDPFFYRDISGSIDYDYIQNLIDKDK